MRHSQPAHEPPSTQQHIEREVHYRCRFRRRDPEVEHQEELERAPCEHLREQYGTEKCLSLALQADPTSKTL